MTRKYIINGKRVCVKTSTASEGYIATTYKVTIDGQTRLISDYHPRFAAQKALMK